MKTLKLIKEDDLQSHEIRESDIVEDLDYIMNAMIIIDEWEFKNKAIYLVPDYDYIVGKDSNGYKILVPLKKRCK